MFFDLGNPERTMRDGQRVTLRSTINPRETKVVFHLYCTSFSAQTE